MFESQSYVKFECTLIDDKEAVRPPDIIEANRLRRIFQDFHLIGETMAVITPGNDPEPVGFGNVSVRKGDSPEFIITGTNTGRYELLEARQYSLVTAVNLPGNTLTCRGCIKASAESMTHSAVYNAIPGVRFVGHAHHPELWIWAMQTPLRFPTTPESAAYGTPEMALAVGRICAGNDDEKGIIVMGGHEEGLLFFGRSVEEVEELVREIFTKFQESH